MEGDWGVGFKDKLGESLYRSTLMTFGSACLTLGMFLSVCLLSLLLPSLLQLSTDVFKEVAAVLILVYYDLIGTCFSLTDDIPVPC